MRCLLIRTRASRETRIRFSSFGVYNPTSLNNCGIEGEKKNPDVETDNTWKKSQNEAEFCLFILGWGDCEKRD